MSFGLETESLDLIHDPTEDMMTLSEKENMVELKKLVTLIEEKPAV